MNMLKSEVSHIMVVTNEDLAEKLKLTPNVLTVYYQPSYLNGFENLVDKNLDI